MSQQSIHCRNLPHWYVPGAAHFVTFRLAGSLPTSAIDLLLRKKEELKREPRAAGTTSAQQRLRNHKRMFAFYDDILERYASDVDWLKDPRIASLVRGSLHYLHDKQYGLIAYCIMSNHVHLLMVPREPAAAIEIPSDEDDFGEMSDAKSPLSKIMHSLKSYTAHEANKILERTGAFWQHESYDHWVRDDEELERIVAYIANNPVKAGLVTRPEDWYWSSAHDRFLRDGELSGFLLHS
jgi:putative DNA methylase